jgi:predicted  nucleic acid-binding Zn-ribbon protein
MTDLDKEIAALESRIEENKVDLKNATTREEKSELRGLIKSRSDTLNELMKQQREATKGML